MLHAIFQPELHSHIICLATTTRLMMIVKTAILFSKQKLLLVYWTIMTILTAYCSKETKSCSDILIKCLVLHVIFWGFKLRVLWSTCNLLWTTYPSVKLGVFFVFKVQVFLVLTDCKLLLWTTCLCHFWARGSSKMDAVLNFVYSYSGLDCSKLGVVSFKYMLF
jgi:hypothetical protein